MSLLSFLRGGPEHCMLCGDEFVRSEYTDGYRRDGSQIVRSWSHCPRNGDGRPSRWERYQQGRCTPPHYGVCANELQAWREHRPWWGSCGHHSVSEDGDACWLKDGTQVTRERQPVAVAA